jgi:solute carrier family 25 protein 14/30
MPVQVRLQLHTQTAGPGLLATTLTIIRQEKWTALMKGVGPAVLRSATYGSMRLGLYEPAKHALATATRHDSSNPIPFTCKCAAAMASGAFAALLTNPLELIKVRAQADSLAVSSWQRLAAISRTEGVFTLWNGVTASMQRSALLTGAI